jgi:Flp pilus assembly protein TadG
MVLEPPPRFRLRRLQQFDNRFSANFNHSQSSRLPGQGGVIMDRSKKLAKRVRRVLKSFNVCRFARRDDGSAAVEFALVIMPFLALMFAIIQTALVFFAQQTLESVAANAARQILTGQAQAQNYNQSQFQTFVCQNFVVALFDCNSRMYIDVRTYTTFGSIGNSLPVDNNGNLVNNFVYQPGNQGDIVVVRLMYEWPLFVNLLGDSVANMSNNTRLLVATAAFRNEPY